ncbi:T3SS effector HopA1 family protein [Streptomyces sp. NPDC094437]|uniref:T3SS effector HopA1 family protein n=1 Tax=Streptomyces sp. NPDC094437 TaxID=3366060 RepID=UPI0037F2AFC2
MSTHVEETDEIDETDEVEEASEVDETDGSGGNDGGGGVRETGGVGGAVEGGGGVPVAPVLSAGLRGALADVRISVDGRTAWVRDDEVNAESPSAMRFLLARTLYEVLHTGRGIKDRTPPRTLRAPDFEARLAKATPHPETVAAGVLTGQRSLAGRRVVEIDGVRVGVPDAVALREDGRTAGGSGRPVVRMELPSARPLLSPGFFLVDSGSGRTGGGELLRLYLRVADADAAPALWHAVLSALERRSVVYRAKIISNPASLPRNDGMVVYLGAGFWDAVGVVAEAAVGTGVPDGPAPAFARVIAPGVTVAWEPRDERVGMRGLSFGEHRAHVVARAFVAAAGWGRECPTDVELAEACVAANVDPADPARNLDSGGWEWGLTGPSLDRAG